MVLRKWEWTTLRCLVFFPCGFPSLSLFNHFPNEQYLWGCSVSWNMPPHGLLLPSWPLALSLGSP